jgi:hypothetical protein
MSLNYEQFASELSTDIPRLPLPRARVIVNRALGKIYSRHPWSFLRKAGFLVNPPTISTGSVGLVQFSRVVTVDATAKTAFDGLGLNPPITRRQIRVSSGPPYCIAAYDPDGITSPQSWNTSGQAALLLDVAYQEETSPLAPFTLLRAYFSPPLDSDGRLNFSYFVRIRDIQDGYNLKIREVNQTQINSADPQRSLGSGTQTPLHVVEAYHRLVADPNDSTLAPLFDEPLFELWPWPNSEKAFYCEYQQKGRELVNDTDTLPSGIPDSLLQMGLLLEACRWIDLNRQYEELKNINTGQIKRELLDPSNEDGYIYQLNRSVKLDNDKMGDNWLPAYGEVGQGSPQVGSNFAFNHAIFGGYEM